MTSKSIRIITDSGSDIAQNSIPGVTVLPMAIRFGDVEYLDGVNLSVREFYEKLIESDELPKTSLVSPGVFEEAYEEAIQRDEDVVVITVSGALSGTYQSAVLAADEYEGRVHVIDSKSVAVGVQILVLRALELIRDGLDAAEIAKILTEERERIHILAVLDTLEYLKKGGRISGAAAFVGGMLSIKPVVTVRDGKVALIGKARGSRNGNNYLIKEIENTSGIDFTRPLCLGYAGLDDTLLKKYIADSRRLWEGHEDCLKTAAIGATIGTHVGPGAIAVAFFANKA